MTDLGNESLTDQDMTTTYSGPADAPQMPEPGVDGDGTDGSDSDGTDGSDSDGTDGTDGDGTDGTDGTDGDGTDGLS